MTVELNLVQESWQELRKYINTMDRSDAAESLVSVLIENGVDPGDIGRTFKDDSDVCNALKDYITDEENDDQLDDIDTDDWDE
jgi:hypothetical protein